MDYLWSGEPDLVRALCEDAWALVRRLRLVVSHRLSRAGLRLAHIGLGAPPNERTEENYAVLREILGRQVGTSIYLAKSRDL